MPRPKDYNKIDSVMIEKICDEIKNELPVSYACKIVGVAESSLYDALKRDASFRRRIDVAKALAVRGLVKDTKKQGGAWKLLKNLGKDEFKELVDMQSDSSGILTIVSKSGKTDIEV